MTKEEARQFGLNLLHGIVERNKVSDPSYADNVKQAIHALLAPSLPSNLDEAVFAYEDSSEYPPANQEEERMVYDAFKAGAEWMAGQGVNSEGKVFTSTFTSTSYVKTPGIEKLLKDAFPEDTEVIVQIRKK